MPPRTVSKKGAKRPASSSKGRKGKDPAPIPAKKAFHAPNPQKVFEEFLASKDVDGVQAALKGGQVNLNRKLKGQPYLVYALNQKQPEIASILLDWGCNLNYPKAGQHVTI